MKYLIAFGRRPMPTFLDHLVKIAAEDGVKIEGSILTTGPGCFNLALLMDENEAFINGLTMALMPAKWTTTEDHIEPGLHESRI